ncbi:uncharacterized protein PFL1_03054 [Pseudozyma flocculosa PF-1]|uniref:Ser-Thr-rich glycosyl-phosphatidyl-inositol-anchored membrane family-domain-containing protein n=2 Tax=Pseudozyma flocculosa TaxID=84751 RepID=A0A5C3EZW2_9BASI|nr:uncharacterized protein PFL1_03054 [Pseudozyma flocculosa PF-1]EPQ29299.1 hypothetical protein PFL1_03054 [Pseudozyma flocculosa PF-1]SPO37813.1 uncharacterized protein PSFLO_03289 [Pseudozyma flocculosa]
MHAALLFSSLSLLAISAVTGLQVTFPTSSDYWVACGWNVLRWTSDANDPPIFSVSIQAQNKTAINDDELAANSLNTKQGAAEVFVPCIAPTDNIMVHLVNASHYDHKNGLLASSESTSIKANGTTPAPNSHQTKISSRPDPNFAAASTNTSLSAPSTSSSSSSSSNAATGQTAANAGATAAGPTSAKPGSNDPATGSLPNSTGDKKNNAAASGLGMSRASIAAAVVAAVLGGWTLV